MQSALQEVKISQAPIKNQMKAVSTLCAISEGDDTTKKQCNFHQVDLIKFAGN